MTLYFVYCALCFAAGSLATSIYLDKSAPLRKKPALFMADRYYNWVDKETGLPCALDYMSGFIGKGYWVGYVGVPSHHPWFGKSYLELYDICKEAAWINLPNLSYSSQAGDYWCLGFDCCLDNATKEEIISICEKFAKTLQAESDYTSAQILNLSTND